MRNSDLLNNSATSSDLKDSLLEHHDYEAVSKKLFSYLKEWYQVDVEIIRYLKADYSTNNLCLDIYPGKI